jgi:hypothetical protein
MTRKRVFVYGANTQGRHGKGAALEAVRFWGAEYGKVGLVGNSYGVITKELRSHRPRVTIEQVAEEVLKLVHTARCSPDLDFVCTEFGTGLAGFSHEEIVRLFLGLDSLPENIYFTPKWANLLIDLDTRA